MSVAECMCVFMRRYVSVSVCVTVYEAVRQCAGECAFITGTLRGSLNGGDDEAEATLTSSILLSSAWTGVGLSCCTPSDRRDEAAVGTGSQVVGVTRGEMGG